MVPLRDEADSLETLHRELDAALSAVEGGVEFVFVDDASRDGSVSVLRALEQKDARVRLVELAEHGGQTAALDAGFRASRGEIIATLDADLQNDPADIPKLLAHLGRADVVNGVRVDRHDSAFRILCSKVANAVRNFVTGDRVTDVGCSLRVMRGHHLRRVKLYRGLHRFLPTLLRYEGARVVEVPVSHRARRYGRSKYGTLDRLGASLLDLLAVRWMKSRHLSRTMREDEDASRRDA